MNLLGFCCIHCHRSLTIRQHGLCSRCNKLIRRFSYCGHCGAELPVDQAHCGQCLRNEPSWDKIVVVGRYEQPLSDFIHRFKFRQHFWLDRTLARLLLLAIYQARRTHQLVLPDVILPVPLHRWRQWRRGYNQADLLADYLSAWLKIPKRNDILKRIKHTSTQRGLSAAERRKNLKNAFILNKRGELAYRSVALVDDVITTGATLNEIAKQLRKKGVQQIQVWGLART